MSTKNIVLTIVICVCAFFIYKNFISISPPISFALENVKGEMVGEWLKKKNVTETAIYGSNETMITILNDYGIRVDENVNNMPSPPADGGMNQGNVPPTMDSDPYNAANLQSQLVPFFSKVKRAKTPSLIFVEGFSPMASVEELRAFLKSGGFIYFREYSNEMNDNVVLHQLLLEHMKKGQVCVIVPKIAEGNVSSMSNKNRVLAENNIFDETNADAFDSWHKEAVKLKQEFQNLPPQ